jgi:zinc transport system ATP-binding protein
LNPSINPPASSGLPDRSENRRADEREIHGKGFGPAGGATEPAVEVRDLHITRGGVEILHGIDFTLQRGRFLGIIGPNGGGKTTLLRALTGLERSDRGTIRVLGMPPGRSRAVGFLPQAPTFDFRFPALVRDVVAMGLPPGAGRAGKQRVDSVIEELGLAALSRTHAGVLSGGERQRLFLARALVREPQLILLDEPTLGVDARALDSFLHLLVKIRAERELTVMMVSHDFSVVSTHADEVLCVAGRIHFCGSPKALDEGLLAEAYGVHTLFLEHRH